MSPTLLGFQRLAQMHGISLVQPLRTRSQVGPSRQRTVVDGHELQTWPARYQPVDSFRGHLTGFTTWPRACNNSTRLMAPSCYCAAPRG